MVAIFSGIIPSYWSPWPHKSIFGGVAIGGPYRELIWRAPDESESNGWDFKTASRPSSFFR